MESGKQIAAHLTAANVTVRGWEESEGLPVHCREHQKQDTVFAHAHEIDRESRRRTPRAVRNAAGTELGIEWLCRVARWKFPPANDYLAEHDAITRTIGRYIAGGHAFTLRHYFRLLSRDRVQRIGKTHGNRSVADIAT